MPIEPIPKGAPSRRRELKSANVSAPPLDDGSRASWWTTAAGGLGLVLALLAFSGWMTRTSGLSVERAMEELPLLLSLVRLGLLLSPVMGLAGLALALRKGEGWLGPVLVLAGNLAFWLLLWGANQPLALRLAGQEL